MEIHIYIGILTTQAPVSLDRILGLTGLGELVRFSLTTQATSILVGSIQTREILTLSQAHLQPAETQASH